MASIIAPIIPAAFAATFLAPGLDGDTLRLFGHWYLADALGLAMITPLVFAWTGQWKLPATWRSIIEPIGFMLLTTLAMRRRPSSDMPCPMISRSMRG